MGGAAAGVCMCGGGDMLSLTRKEKNEEQNLHFRSSSRNNNFKLSTPLSTSQKERDQSRAVVGLAR